MPPEMVLATSVDRKAPTMLRIPLTRTAVLGASAPVAMEVAIALAVSWNPLVPLVDSLPHPVGPCRAAARHGSGER